MSTYRDQLSGLSDEQVLESRTKNGSNTWNPKQENRFLMSLIGLLTEPMVLLLFAAVVIYFVSGAVGDAIFMLSAIVLVTAISLYQENRSHNALEALKNLTQPNARVIRNGEEQAVPTAEIVVGDLIIVEEGSSVPADGTVLQCNDFLVNESMLTGESLPVSKSIATDTNAVAQGTIVSGGLAICRVEAIGANTRLAKIGKSLADLKEEDSPLQVQITHFVKMMAIAGSVVFFIVWGINFYDSRSWLDSLLKALTLAMSILPEEIPVAFATFMALGARRLMKIGVIVKQVKTVETLGSATVICTDKTGTITENNMTLAKVFVWPTRTVAAPDSNDEGVQDLITCAMWASEPIPFDPMELALHQAYSKSTAQDERPQSKLVHEYPLGGQPPMMTHVFENAAGKRVIAAKGAPEAFMPISGLSEAEQKQALEAVNQLAAEGYRVLGVGAAVFEGTDYPAEQQQFKFEFKGFVAFYDPPKKNIQSVFEAFYKAGIAVKIITGDNTATTTTIAKQVGLKGAEKSLQGSELMALSEAELESTVLETNIFTRMFPEAKLRIIHALKNRGQIVAMTGDGVNDGPALKAAHIGIAMGKKGSEIAKTASSLILADDDLAKMVDAVAIGRKIYTNLKKAIQYVISIHIPIILTVFIPLVLGWIYPNIFTPVHIIFMEMIMGPTCSIIYENEPMEENTISQPPRPIGTTFFSWNELSTSILQGLGITVGTLVVYQIAVQQGCTEAATRTMVFVALITANILLTLVNRSFYYSILTTLRYKNNLVPLIISITLLLIGVMLWVPMIANFFQFEQIPLSDIGMSAGIGCLSVIWYEGVKAWKRGQNGTSAISQK